jgi:hypothetical protein
MEESVAGLAAVVHGYNQISLSWTDDSTVDWYDIEIQDGGGRWNHVRSVYASEVDMAGFDAATQYSIRVRGVHNTWPDWSYTGYSSTVTPTTSVYQTNADYVVTGDADWTIAVANAVCGQVIEIKPGVVLTHKTVPTYRAGTAKFVTIRSSNVTSLPGFDSRVGPSDAANMPTFRTTTTSAAALDFPAGELHHLTFEGIRFKAEYVATSRTNYNVRLGTPSTYTNDPYNIEFHRCYFDSPAPDGSFSQADTAITSYGGARVVIKDSYFKEFAGILGDTQALFILRGHEWAVNNCHIEGGAENIMLGGSSHADTNYNPHLFSIRRNHFYKPLNWKPDDPSFDGQVRRIKNLFEVKYGEKLLVEDNLMEHNWTGNQYYAIVLTPRDQGTMTWVTDKDIHIRYNHIRKVNGGVSFLAHDYNGDVMTESTNRITIKHNLFEDVAWGGYYRWIEFNNVTFASGNERLGDISITRNTLATEYSIPQAILLAPNITAANWPDGQGVAGTFDLSSNIMEFGTSCIKEDGGSYGITAMDSWLGVDKYTWANNVQYGEHPVSSINNSTDFPGQYHEPEGIAHVGFEDYQNNDFSLASSSDYYGQNIGADVSALTTRTLYCESGDWTS